MAGSYSITKRAAQLTDGKPGAERIFCIGVVGEKIGFAEFTFKHSVAGKIENDGVGFGDGTREPCAERGLNRGDRRVRAGKQSHVVCAGSALLHRLGEESGVAVGKLKLLTAGELLIFGNADSDDPGL